MDRAAGSVLALERITQDPEKSERVRGDAADVLLNLEYFGFGADAVRDAKDFLRNEQGFEAADSCTAYAVLEASDLWPANGGIARIAAVVRARGIELVEGNAMVGHERRSCV